MLFNSYIFILFFLPITVTGYFLFNHFQKYVAGEVFLLIMSLWFYGYFNISYLPVILSSIVINYGIYRLFQIKTGRTPKGFRKMVLYAGIAFNIGILFYFKYYDFFAENINALFHTDLVLKNLMLPLGISFFTFQQLSFVIDAYRGEIPAYSPEAYALFVTFFPQLIAGPIVTHDELVPQLSDLNRKRVCWMNLSQGIYIFSIGLAKKVLIADLFGNVANWGFGNYLSLDTTNAFLTMLSYTIQIYFDFSGYCDMAIGIGKMLNIDLPLNLNSPYKALTITEFWKRWHMTLTRFFSRYVYIPLGGNRKGLVKMCRNTIVVFLVSGLWHGANWTFILWGGVHGIFSVLTKVFKGFFDSIHPALNWMLTFLFVNIMWVFFRADSILQAFVILKRIAAFNIGPVSSEIIHIFNLKELLYIQKKAALDPVLNNFPVFWTLVFFGSAILIILGRKNSYEMMQNFHMSIWDGVHTVICLVWGILSLCGVSTFLYFNF